MSTCENCTATIASGQEVVLKGEDKTITICSNCADQIDEVFKGETKEPNLMGAGLIGLGAGLISALIWYGIVVVTNYQVGFIAIAVGWLVGQAVVFGSGGKRGFALQGLSVIITIIAMIFSEYLVIRHFAVQGLAEEGITNIPLLLPLDLIFNLIVEGITANPLTLVFWAIAAWQAFSIPARRRLQRG